MNIMTGLTMTLIFSVPGIAYAHPDIIGAKVQFVNHTEIPHEIKNFNLKTSTDNNDLEIFSEKWFWNNFIIILYTGIIGIMLPVIVIVYKRKI